MNKSSNNDKLICENIMRPKVYIAKTGSDLEKSIRESLKWIDYEKIIRPGNRVFIKPNLTFTVHRQGVTVSPLFLKSLVTVLRDLTPNITIGESDGGYGSYTAEEAFYGHNLFDMSKELGFDLVNLSKCEKEYIDIPVGNKAVPIPLPKMLLNDVDVFISVAVPKVHSMTGISLCVKNQWGCIPDKMRLLHHYLFEEAIIKINKLLNPGINFIDGTYGLTENGPIIGVPLKLDLILASDNIWAIDSAGSHIMSFDIRKARYLSIAKESGLLPSVNEINFNDNINNFISDKFFLKRTMWNRYALFAFKHKFASKIVYDSTIGDILHWIMYATRGRIHMPRFKV